MAEPQFTGSLKPGVTLDKYEIREQLAAGGMAIIYKAYDPTLDRYVAVKHIAPHLASDEKFVVRFRTEAQTLARLSASQANIVHVHELIQQDGQLYLVMEYLEGTTLRTIMDRGPVPLQTGLGVMLSTGLGLRAMHAQGIVHRDLTPANIMMARDGALKITDFGLIGHSGGRTSLPMGTTKYMAPEMFTGAPVDPRADLYSLGMIAYEMFAGPEKFGQAFRDVLRDEKAQQVRWMHWHSNVAQKAPPLKELQPGIPPLVSKIIERLMEKDPSKRFASADQIVRWLRKIFVMHVQGKSVSQTDSESMEKEMEAEASAPALAGVRPGAGAPSAAGAAPAAETGEKTAPLVQPVWTWKRAAFWASVVAGPLLLAAIGLLAWKYSEEQKRAQAAEMAVQMADELMQHKDYAGAAAAYRRIIQDYADLTQFALHALAWSHMARAEEALQKKDWQAADEAANAAQQKEAPPAWVADFRSRFQKERDVDEKMTQVDAAIRTRDFEGAKRRLQDLIARYPDLKVNEKLVEIEDQIQQRQYRALVDEGQKAFDAKPPDLAAALEAFEKAQRTRDTPEIQDKIKTVKMEQDLATRLAEAAKAVADGKWSEAAAAYQACLELKPLDEYRLKMNSAKAEEFAAKGKMLEDSGLMKEALEQYLETLKYNPQHPRALEFVKRQGQAEQLAGFLKAGDEAMVRNDFRGAASSYTSALGVAGDQQKPDIQKKLSEAKNKETMVEAHDALAQNNFSKAREKANEAKTYVDSADIPPFLEEVDKREQFKQKMDVALELMKQGKFLPAIAEFRAAYKIFADPKIPALINDCEYRRHFLEAKLLLDAKQVNEARAMFILAQRYKDTPEVEGYIKMCEDILKAEREKKGQGGP